MRTLRSVAALRDELAPARREGLTIGLVPTMGALHEGHLSLIRHAREHCDVVVVSLFVNPAQFNERSDLDRYPRDEDADSRLAATAGADVLFAPSVEEVYPNGFATSVEVLGVSERLEGVSRGAEHFRGVATVVTKLLCMALPDVAYFGQKDAQQVVVIHRLATDLNLPVKIEALPTVREADGLAMSSRNALLSKAEREQAPALHAALDAAAQLAATGEKSAELLLAAGHSALAGRDVALEYLALVDPETLEPLARLERQALLAIAARIGQVRLIDNTILQPAGAPATANSQNPPGKAIATCSA
ncbi:MAG TPA: pantoate--beta-alanine ligase [Solirubrobacteraceae bacterium]|jgi:pantoate--beta-alanine ligase|nr:pantoate--beta-alanine ligase [Solirubrobacteraceae bacterium]